MLEKYAIEKYSYTSKHKSRYFTDYEKCVFNINLLNACIYINKNIYNFFLYADSGDRTHFSWSLKTYAASVL